MTRRAWYRCNRLLHTRKLFQTDLDCKPENSFKQIVTVSSIKICDRALKVDEMCLVPLQTSSSHQKTLSNRSFLAYSQDLFERVFWCEEYDCNGTKHVSSTHGNHKKEFFKDKQRGVSRSLARKLFQTDLDCKPSVADESHKRGVSGAAAPYQRLRFVIAH